jgi:predicted nucleotidyltransferase
LDLSLAPIVEVLQDCQDLILAYAFGSIATGTASPASDADIAVLEAQPLTSGDRIGLIGRLAEATGRPIDLIDLREVGSPLLQVVLTTGRELFCRDTGAKALLMAKMVTDAEDFLPLRRRLLKERRDKWTD